MKQTQPKVALEDLLLGQGDYYQVRRGQKVPVTAIPLIWPVSTYQEMLNLNTDHIRHAQIINKGMLEQFVFKKTLPNPEDFETALQTNKGYWVPLVAKNIQSYNHPTFEQVDKRIAAIVDSQVTRKEHDIAYDKLLKDFQKLSEAYAKQQVEFQELQREVKSFLKENQAKSKFYGAPCLKKRTQNGLTLEQARQIISNETQQYISAKELYEFFKLNMQNLMTKHSMDMIVHHLENKLLSKTEYKADKDKQQKVYLTHQDIQDMLDNLNG